MIRWSLE